LSHEYKGEIEKWRHGDTKSNVDRSRPRDGRELFYANLKENKKRKKKKKVKTKKGSLRLLLISAHHNCPTV
jgi:hypothetical protein